MGGAIREEVRGQGKITMSLLKAPPQVRANLMEVKGDTSSRRQGHRAAVINLCKSTNVLLSFLISQGSDSRL